VALAGFTSDEVALTVEHNVLTLEGHKSEKEGKTFLHRGISARNFKRQFTLADHVEVKGARFENGLLVIDLQREIPEAMKPAPHSDRRHRPEQRDPDRGQGR
jgi:molecular chaperone IbpA